MEDRGIADRTRDFTGREWLFRRLDAWLEGGRPPVFLLTGKPGSGKSALAARLVQMSRGDVPAGYSHLGPGSLSFFHFCQALNDPTLNPLRLVEALSQALARRHLRFAEALLRTGERAITITQQVAQVERGGTVVGVENVHIGSLSARDAFDLAVRKPLEQLCTPDFSETILILVDALDEALTYHPDESIVTLLSHATGLPPQVRLLLTSRPDPRVLHLIGNPSLDLVDDAPDDMADVRAYAQRRLQALSAHQRLTLADRVATAGKGNFLYARYVLDDLLSRDAPLKDPSHLPLPEGLDDVYRQFLKRELGWDLTRWDERYRPLLGALAVARGEGLTRAQLAGVTGRSLAETGTLLRACAQYLTGSQPDGPFQIYHQSFRDFLLTDIQYQVYAAEANQAIAGFFLEEFRDTWQNCEDGYALHSTPAHLMAAIHGAGQRRQRRRLMDDLVDLLTNFHYLEARIERFNAKTLIDELKTAGTLVSTAGGSADTLLVELYRALGNQADLLRDWDREQYPAFLAQQLYLPATMNMLAHLAASTRARLRRIGRPYLEWVWYHKYNTAHGVTTTHDGRYAIFALTDKTVRVFDLQSGEETRVLTGHENWAVGVAVTHDDRRVVSGSLDHAVRVWDLQSGQAISTLTGHTGGVPGIAITSDDRYVISASLDHTLRVWNLEAGKTVRVLADHQAGVYTLALSPDDSMVVSASYDHTLKVWDFARGQVIRSLIGHTGNVMGVGITPDGKQVLSASVDGTLRVWDLTTGETVRVIQAHDTHAGRKGATDLAVARDGRRIVSCGWHDETIKVWDLETGQELARIAVFPTLYGVALAPDNVTILAGGAPGLICFRYVDPNAA